MKEKYGDKRRTEIIQGTFDIEDEDLIPVEDVIITLTESGYIKRQLVDTYRAQNRGGRGIKSLTLNEEDSIDTMISMSTHDFLLLFTDKGRVYRLKGYNVPSGSRTSKGIPIVNLMTLEKGEKGLAEPAADRRARNWDCIYHSHEQHWRQAGTGISHSGSGVCKRGGRYIERDKA